MPEPVPWFDHDGGVHFAFRWTDAELAEIYMANEMYAASPDGQESVRRALEGLPRATIEISGTWDGDEAG